MYYLGLALYAEGRTDYEFLVPLLRRLSEGVCAAQAPAPVDVADVVALDHPEDTQEQSRDARVTAAAALHQGAWDIVFVHADGAADPQRARTEAVEPALASLRHRFPDKAPGVAVVPVRETEAWLLVDGDALRSVFGTSLSDMELGLPGQAHLAESCLDPKAVLQDAFMRTRPSGLRRRRGVSPMLAALGEQVSLERLNRLPSYQRLTTDLEAALRHIGVLPP